MNNIVMTVHVLFMTPNIRKHHGNLSYSWERLSSDRKGGQRVKIRKRSRKVMPWKRVSVFPDCGMLVPKKFSQK